ncbi:TIGR03618 family F420-dependent PPOX class oxidoreductase [Streptomyces sp. NPDC051569]|uniref:TIGR03618 family F420-dependent PPOX class oxidoreductase n=1 Tax=Streptomyces sp. NPDC051569 TaxID=3365661 RepID=UPI0037A01C5B
MAAPHLRSDPEFLAFWQERHIGFLSTTRPDGTPHLVPVGVTYDSETGIARVITSATSKKARNIVDAGPGAVAAVSQAEGARWATLEGTAVVKDDPDAVADAVERYTRRYRPPRVNPRRVVIEITVTRTMGAVKPL